MTSLPDELTAKRLVELIDYRNIILDRDSCSVFLSRKGMRIGFGGIGKGYAAEMAKTLLINEGVKSGIVNASGDLAVWGRQANGSPWTIGIADPEIASLPFSFLELKNGAIATSGNYEKYILINGRKFSHTINPKTGYPITGIKSVTIITKNAELADAMTTPVMVMGIKAGINMINQLPGIECIIIDDTNRIHKSKNINFEHTTSQERGRL
jgi:thiamine biosynthesis lipoprotein